MADPAGRSPFVAVATAGETGDGWELADEMLGETPGTMAGGTVRVTDCSGGRLWQLHGEAAARLAGEYGPPPGGGFARVLRDDDTLLWAYTVDRWFRWSPRESAEIDGPMVVPDAGVTDLTHGVATLRVSGPAATSVLDQICPIDLRPMPDGSALRTSMAQVVVDVVVVDADGPSYLLICGRSLGPYLWEVVGQAAGVTSIRYQMRHLNLL